jgi:hypothetical protein
MNNELATVSDMGQIEQVLMTGDLSKLTPEQRVNYYNAVCKSTGLNPLTRPFDYITLNSKLTLYARKDATDQLRKINAVSIDDVEMSEVGETYFVKVKGHDNTGRSDVEIGVVSKKDMQGNAANAQMKAVTKAKRRLTLSICGLGWLDETEVETIPDARPVKVAPDTGEIIDAEVTPDKPAKSLQGVKQSAPVTGANLERADVEEQHADAWKRASAAHLLNPETIKIWAAKKGCSIEEIEAKIMLIEQALDPTYGSAMPDPAQEK